MQPGKKADGVLIKNEHSPVSFPLVNAAETSRDTLLTDHLPALLRTAGEISGEWATWQGRPHVELPARAHTA